MKNKCKHNFRQKWIPKYDFGIGSTPVTTFLGNMATNTYYCIKCLKLKYEK